MGSSFLTTINLGLGLYCVISFFKNIVQFGLPNHPRRFTLYFVTFCAMVFFVMKVMADLNLLNPFFYLRYQSLPLVAGGLGLLIQVMTVVGNFSHVQQKVISRIPLMGGLLVFAFFWQYAEWFFAICLLISVLFLTISVGKARYQKRILSKMTFFLALFLLFKTFNYFWLYIVGELFLYPALFYFFIFEQTYGVSALVEEHHTDSGVG